MIEPIYDMKSRKKHRKFWVGRLFFHASQRRLSLDGYMIGTKMMMFIQ